MFTSIILNTHTNTTNRNTHTNKYSTQTNTLLLSVFFLSVSVLYTPKPSFFWHKLFHLSFFYIYSVCASPATVLISIRTVSLEEGLVFGSPTYNFSVPENEPKDTVVGAVIATSGSALYDVNYALKTHADLFSVDASGSIRSLAELNKETKEFYILSVEATDTRTPPNTAQTVVN